MSGAKPSDDEPTIVDPATTESVPAATEAVSTSTEPPTTVVTFTKQWMSYYAGEKAAFAPDVAARLIDEGFAEGGDPPPPDPDAEVAPHEDATS
jgi:hypothetical protein